MNESQWKGQLNFQDVKQFGKQRIGYRVVKQAKSWRLVVLPPFNEIVWKGINHEL